MSNLVASIGVKVSAANEEIMTEPEITILNSRNKRPVIPCIKTIGKNTATSVMVVEITAKKYLFGSFYSRFFRTHSFFDTDIDVLRHYDGVIHHQSHGQHNGQAWKVR